MHNKCNGRFHWENKMINQKIKGIAGNAQATCQGTVHWHVEDNDGAQHTLKIKGCYYMLQSPKRILSPLHFA